MWESPVEGAHLGRMLSTHQIGPGVTEGGSQENEKRRDSHLLMLLNDVKWNARVRYSALGMEGSRALVEACRSWELNRINEHESDGASHARRTLWYYPYIIPAPIKICLQLEFSFIHFLANDSCNTTWTRKISWDHHLRTISKISHLLKLPTGWETPAVKLSYFWWKVSTY